MTLSQHQETGESLPDHMTAVPPATESSRMLFNWRPNLNGRFQASRFT